MRGTKLAPLMRSRGSLWLWRKILAAGVDEVHAVLDDFHAAGVPVWLAGGWGIDALIGRPTRRHDDIDLVVPKEYQGEGARILAARGFEPRDEEVRTVWFPHRITWRDNLGRSIDLLPVPITEGDKPADSVSCNDRSFTTGMLGGRPLPCLSPQMQIDLHRGYELRDIDRTDVATLCRLIGQPVPAELR